MRIGYLRVSTESQKEDRQEDGLKAICDELYVEKISAACKSRPVYQHVIDNLQAGDTLVVWDLDRAFRSTVDALLEVEKLRRRYIEFHIINLNVDTATPAGLLVFTVMAAFSQFERQMLIERTRQGMISAKLRGKHIGRPRNPILEQVVLAHSAIEAGEFTLDEMAERFRCSKKKLAQELDRLKLDGTLP